MGRAERREQLWEELSAEIENYLTTISLADMMQNDEVQELSRAHDLRQQQNLI
jgi:DNA-binding IscR family transcriptional regulator